MADCSFGWHPSRSTPRWCEYYGNRQSKPCVAYTLAVSFSGWINNRASKPRALTLRRVSVVALAVVLPFILTVLGSSIIEDHTRDGRLAMWLILHSQKMTDQQLADAIGEDPFAVLRRSGLMLKAIAPTVAIIIGILVAFLERKMPGRTRQVALCDPPHRRLRRLCCRHRRSDGYRVERSSSRAGLSSRCGPVLFHGAL
jgi:hypothetical protein